MRAGLAIGLGAALSACSPAPQSGTGTADDGQSVAPTQASGSTASSPRSTPGTGGLRGQVSDLTGAVSDLDTRVTDMGTVIDLYADALFEFDKATLTPAAEAQLRKASAMIAAAPPGAIGIVGHTDGKGEAQYNLRLSQARAEAVAAWFQQQPGIRQRPFRVSAKGETAPIAADTRPDGTDNPDGRAKNRRVEVVLPKDTTGGAS